MTRKRYPEEKIIAILRRHQAGASATRLARRDGIAENTLHRRISKYGGSLCRHAAPPIVPGRAGQGRS